MKCVHVFDVEPVVASRCKLNERTDQNP